MESMLMTLDEAVVGMQVRRIGDDGSRAATWLSPYREPGPVEHYTITKIWTSAQHPPRGWEGLVEVHENSSSPDRGHTRFPVSELVQE